MSSPFPARHTVPLADVDRAVHDYLAEQGISELAHYHVGHNIGLGAHEPPYIDEGLGGHVDEGDRTMESGHVYTTEPGLYTEETGYRHSETVAITEDGHEVLTHFPRDLESGTIR